MDRHITCVCSCEYPSSDYELAPCHQPDMVQIDEDLILCGNCGHEQGCHQPQLALCECTGAEAPADHAQNASDLRAENEKLRLVAIAMGRELMRVNEIMLAECGNGLVNLHLLDPIRKHLS